MRPLPLILLTLLTAACETTPTSTTQPVLTWYSHEGAEALYRSARYADAETMCRDAIVQIEKARGKNAPEIAEPLIDIATVQLRLAKYPEAKVTIDHAQSLLSPDTKTQALLIGRLGINKGWRLYSLGETEAARKVFADSHALLEKHAEKTGPSAKDLAEIINNEALMIEEIASEADDEEALKLSRRMLLQAWQMRRKLTGDHSPETAESLNNLGMHLLFNSDGASEAELAMNTLKKALEVTAQVYGETNPETAMGHTNLALAYLYSDNLSEADKEINIAIPITQQFYGPTHPDRSYQLTVLGRIQQHRNQFERAEKSFLEALAITESTYGKNSPNVTSPLTYLSNLYEETGDATKQQDVERRIERISGKGI